MSDFQAKPQTGAGEAISGADQRRKKKAPAMPSSTASAQNTDPLTSRTAIVAEPPASLKLPPRQARVIDALRPGGWVSRERIDREAGSSNGPDVVWKLRRKIGQDAIDMELIDGTDRDGKPCRTGRYRLTEQGRTRLAQLGLSSSTEGRATA